MLSSGNTDIFCSKVKNKFLTLESNICPDNSCYYLHKLLNPIFRPVTEIIDSKMRFSLSRLDPLFIKLQFDRKKAPPTVWDELRQIES